MRFPEELLIHKRIPLRNAAWTHLLRLIGQQIHRLKIKSWYWSRKKHVVCQQQQEKKRKIYKEGQENLSKKQTITKLLDKSLDETRRSDAYRVIRFP